MKTSIIVTIIVIAILLLVLIFIGLSSEDARKDSTKSSPKRVQYPLSNDNNITKSSSASSSGSDT